MERTYEFKIGQKVRTKDDETGQTVYGVVTDKSRDTVFIKWVDLTDPVEHTRDDFHKIRLGL